MLSYLWNHRERHALGSRSWFKSWAKRILTLPDFLRRTGRVVRLRCAGARIGEGAILSELNISNPAKVLIGENSFVGRVHMQAQADIRIGDRVCINDGVRLLTASHDVRDPDWGMFSAPIVIEDFAWVATDAIILPGVRIGRGAVVGAGAVVAKDVPDFAVAVGNPAQIRSNVRCPNLQYDPTAFVALLNAWIGPAKRDYRNE